MGCRRSLMRYLAIDPGGKRTGLAVGDDGTGIVSPLEVVEADTREKLLVALERVVREQEPGALVVGLPLNMDGSEGAGARAAKELARVLGKRFGLPVRLADERLSSFEAEERLRELELTRGKKKQRRDALAAAAILQSFFRSRGSGPGG
ncbi:MAG: Holliday junction resolvase RuvX [Phycisphaeraceae bacterium]|nr:Holliday junction resolvase RuvX [Phycisphaeraceae bacterium]